MAILLILRFKYIAMDIVAVFFEGGRVCRDNCCWTGQQKRGDTPLFRSRRSKMLGSCGLGLLEKTSIMRGAEMTLA
jgi:hypothetical protein